MDSLSRKNFGIVIAYLLPGLIVLWGASHRYELIASWFYGASTSQDITIGGLLYTTLSSLLAGLVCSTVRWMLIDTIHHRTGVPKPDWDFAMLQKNLEAYYLLEENHYRYYQFYANSLIAWLVGYGFWRTALWRGFICLQDLGFAALAVVFYLGSRDTLQKYYRRVHVLLHSK